MSAYASTSFRLPGALHMRTPPPRPRRDTGLVLLNLSNATSWKAEALLRNLGFPQGPRSSLKELVGQSGRPVWVSHLQCGAKSCFPKPSPRFTRSYLPLLSSRLRSLEWEGCWQGVLPGMASGPSDLTSKRPSPQKHAPSIASDPSLFSLHPPPHAPSSEGNFSIALKSPMRAPK